MHIQTYPGALRFSLVLDLSISPYKLNLHIYIISITIIDEDDAEVPYYDVSTEQATEEMPFDFDNNSSKISPYKLNLHIYIISITIIDEDDAEVPYYDVSTEQATEEMPFDFGAGKIIEFKHNFLLLSGAIECYYFIMIVLLNVHTYYS